MLFSLRCCFVVGGILIVLFGLEGGECVIGRIWIVGVLLFRVVIIVNMSVGWFLLFFFWFLRCC